MKKKTLENYQKISIYCQSIFKKKTQDYGTAWRIMRPPSITDQIYIKAQRIRSIQEKGTQKITDNIESEFVAIINYCIIALLQLNYVNDPRLEIPTNELMKNYNSQATKTLDLMKNKNQDYAEAWREMRVNSITDIILMKILRIKQIEDNKGKTIISEGVEANYQDIINYSVFSLILLKFQLN